MNRFLDRLSVWCEKWQANLICAFFYLVRRTLSRWSIIERSWENWTKAWLDRHGFPYRREIWLYKR